jgi:two-component system chemotaxis response regulator CheY
MPVPTRVLVIDDDSDTTAAVHWVLEDAGYVVLEAADGTAALDVLHASPDGLVVLFDYRMPRLDGEKLMALAEREQMLVQRHSFVCMTASPTFLPPTLSALLARYDVPLLAKPFGIDELLAVIGQVAQRLALLRAPVPQRATPQADS